MKALVKAHLFRWSRGPKAVGKLQHEAQMRFSFNINNNAPNRKIAAGGLRPPEIAAISLLNRLQEN